MPVIAGTGSNSTAEAVELTRHAKSAGADGVLVVTPYYNKPTQEGLYLHFKAINDCADIPIIIYNIPGRSVVDMSVETMARLFKLNEYRRASRTRPPTWRASSQQRAAIGTEFVQLSGEDATALGFMAHGGQGCISVTANIAPALCSEFQLACLGGNFKRALRAAGPADAAARRAVRRVESRPGEIRGREARALLERDAAAARAARAGVAGRRSTRRSPRSASSRVQCQGQGDAWRRSARAASSSPKTARPASITPSRTSSRPASC